MVLEALCVEHSCSPVRRPGDSRAEEISTSGDSNGPEATDLDSALEDHTYTTLELEET